MTRRTGPRLSAVVVTHDEGRLLVETVRSLLTTLPADAELIVVDDGSSDGSVRAAAGLDAGVIVTRPPRRLGTVAARNHGAARASGAVVVFSDAHVEAPPGWADALLDPLADPSVGAVGPAIVMMRHRAAKGYGLRFADAALTCEWGPWPGPEAHPVPMLGAGFLAMRRDVFDALGGFDAGMIRYGMEDPDLAIRLWTLGYSCLVVPTVEVAHVFRNGHAHQEWELWMHNVVRFGAVHFGRRRLARLLAEHAADPALPAALARVMTSDAARRRREVHARRIRDDDWYFSAFGM